MNGKGGTAQIVLSDVKAQNGIVHVIDTVMLPLFGSVLEIAASFDDFSILVAAVDAADLRGTLLKPGPFTVFAPRNEAFLVLLDELRVSLEDVLNIPSLAQILLYHVLSGRVSTADLQSIVDGEGTDTVSTVNGQSVRVIADSDSASGLALLDQQSDISAVGLSDVGAFNGVVHVVDRVLIPKFESVFEVAVSFEDYSILVDLVKRANLAQTLSKEGPFTVLAPNNAAFAKLGSELRIDLDDLLNLPILKEVLLYHVIGRALLVQPLVYGQDWNTANGQIVDVEQKRNFKVSGFKVDGVTVTDEQGLSANLIIGNVETLNGIVHVIDRPLIPLFESIVQIATSFDDYSILVRFCSEFWSGFNRFFFFFFIFKLILFWCLIQVDLVEKANLVDTLTNDGPFTVFAPNNNAFDRLMDELLIEMKDLLNLPILKEVLLYHVVSGQFTAEQLPRGDLETVNGQKVDVLPYDLAVNGFAVSGLKVADAQQRKSEVIIGNVLASNGVVHVVEQVLIPMFKSIFQIAESFDDYSILVRCPRRCHQGCHYVNCTHFIFHFFLQKTVNELVSE